MPKEYADRRRKIHILITLGVMAFIFIHSAMPGDVSGNESMYFAGILASLTGIPIDAAQFIVRKAAHFTEFMILGICLAVNFQDLKCKSNMAEQRFSALIANHRLVAAWVTGTLYACTDEFHQLFVMNREGSIRDVCIDSAGVLTGVLYIIKVIQLVDTDNME